MEFPRLAETNQELPPDLGYVERIENDGKQKDVITQSPNKRLLNPRSASGTVLGSGDSDI